MDAPPRLTRAMTMLRQRAAVTLTALRGRVGAVVVPVRSHAQRFRNSRAFVPSMVAVAVLALSSTAGGYSAWDATRIDVPDVIGQPLPAGVAELDDMRLSLNDVEIPDEALDGDCYSITEQSVAGGTRVVPEDTIVSVEIQPAIHEVPNVVGESLANARDELLSQCFHGTPQFIGCVPSDFSGGEEALLSEEFASEFGFTYDPWTSTLRHPSLIANESWTVCDQGRVASSGVVAESDVDLFLTVPLTTVPSLNEPVLTAALDALRTTADGCSLDPEVIPLFSANPEAIRDVRPPSQQAMASWSVLSLTPSIGHVLLCDETVRVEVAWPSTTSPQLIGLYHVPAAGQSGTAATAPVEASGLTAACSGRGTVTSQVPAAGAVVPIGTSVTCVAQLVMPSIVGMDPTSAAATLTAAGVSGFGSGTGVVVSQSPQAGTVLTGTQSASYQAAPPAPPSSGYAYYENCTAARAAGAAPVYSGDPGYGPHLDRDRDGVGCE